MKRGTVKRFAACITAAAMITGLFGAMPVAAAEDAKAPILEYTFDEEYTAGAAKDTAGNNDAVLTTGATYVHDEEYGQVLYLDGGTEVGGHNSYLEFPQGFFDGRDEMTISMDVNEVTRRGYFFTFTFGQDSSKYLFLKTDPTAMKLAITNNGSSGEDIASTSFVYPNNVREWINVKMVITPDSLSLYQDGRLLVKNANVDVSVSDLGENLKAYIGRSFYSADKYFRGYFDNVRVYDYAMTAEEVQSVTAAEEEARVEKMTDLHYVANRFEIPNADDIRGNISLPKEKNGVAITWTSSNEDVISTEEVPNEDYEPTPAGVVTRQEEDTMVKLTATFTKDGESVVKHYSVIVKAAVDADEEEYVGYLFVRFTGTEANGMEEQTYFSISEDGLHWSDLNNGEPVLVSTIGESGLRDHYIGRTAEGDKFYMIATDLNMYHGNHNWPDARRNGGNGIVVWESEDLVNWSEPWITDFAPDNNGCTWAPEFVYDHTTGEYVVFWSATTIELDDNDKIIQEYENYAIYYAKTRDFKNYTETKIYNPTEEEKLVPGRDVVIDSTIIEHEGIYYRYTKNEGNGRIQLDCATAMLNEFTPIQSTTLSSTLPSKQGSVEGPIIFKMNEKNEKGEDQWCLMVDRFARAQGYYPLITTDLASGEFELLNNSDFSFPEKYRHGYVLPITKTEYDALQAKWGAADYFSIDTLEKAIDDAWMLDFKAYTDESFDNLIEVLDEAEDKMDNCTSMKEVNELTAKIEAAVDALVPELDSLELINPDKVEFEEGEDADLSGMVVVAHYKDGSVADVTADCKIDMNPSKAVAVEGGKKQPVQIRFEGQELEFEVFLAGGELPYTDVADADWFYKAVEYTYYKGLMTGMDPTTFGPYGQLSRAQFALILYRMEGTPAVETTKSFTDITGDEWYGPAVLWAAEAGIVNGYEGGAFGPADLITREQMAVMMYRYAKYLGEDVSGSGDISSFADAAKVSPFATDAFAWAVGNGIITGKDNGTKLDAQGNTTRAEAAVILQRFMTK